MRFKLVESIEQFDLQGAVIDALYAMFSGQFYLNTFGEYSSITLHNMDCTKNFEIIIKKSCIVVQENGKTIRTFKNATVSSARRAVQLVKKEMG